MQRAKLQAAARATRTVSFDISAACWRLSKRLAAPRLRATSPDRAQRCLFAFVINGFVQAGKMIRPCLSLMHAGGAWRARVHATNAGAFPQSGAKTRPFNGPNWRRTKESGRSIRRRLAETVGFEPTSCIPDFGSAKSGMKRIVGSTETAAAGGDGGIRTRFMHSRLWLRQIGNEENRGFDRDGSGWRRRWDSNPR